MMDPNSSSNKFERFFFANHDKLELPIDVLSPMKTLMFVHFHSISVQINKESQRQKGLVTGELFPTFPLIT